MKGVIVVDGVGSGGATHSPKRSDVATVAARFARICASSQVNLNAPVATITVRHGAHSIDWLDCCVIGYLVLPLVLFLAGWCNLWVGVTLIGCTVYSLIPLAKGRLSGIGPKASASIVLLSFAVAAIWTYLGGIGHFRFANFDWHIRDAVLRDLVVSAWPVGYGEHQGQDTILRTTVAYFLPTAALGKLVGVHAAQALLLVWTSVGAGLFLLQVITLLPGGKDAIVTAFLVILLFSGMDAIGGLLNSPEYFLSSWRIDSHLEWWAEDYQYSSMTTQLFWVPNHALGGWLFVGVLLRNNKLTYELLPLTLVALILWSPLTTAGVLPFLLWRYGTNILSGQSPFVLYPRTLVGALLVAVPVVGYVTLDVGGINRGIMSLTSTTLFRLLQFFLLEVGIIGWIVWALRPSALLLIAILVLFILPIVSFGQSNDFVMRASIPSLAVLAISVCIALTTQPESARARFLKGILIAVLCAGAVTPIQEIARSFVQPRWEPRTDVTLVGASCGRYWHHYIARLDESPLRYLLRSPNALPVGAKLREYCELPIE